MIIACPACKTRYVVPDSAIGLEGRTVRCAKCKHSWFQDGPLEMATVAAAPRSTEVSRGATSRPAPSAAAGTAMDEGRRAEPAVPPFAESGFDEAEPPYHEIPSPEVTDEPAFDEDVSQFDHRPPFRPRRNWVKLASWSAGLFAVVALGVTIAVNTVGLPSWVPVDRPLFAMAEPGLKIAFPVAEQERRTLPNGTEFFGARIVVTNQTRATKSVPPLLIVLRDERERVVFSWEVTPTQKSLAPGESMTINEAITDIPKSAVYADIGWAPR